MAVKMLITNVSKNSHVLEFVFVRVGNVYVNLFLLLRNSLYRRDKLSCVWFLFYLEIFISLCSFYSFDVFCHIDEMNLMWVKSLIHKRLMLVDVTDKYLNAFNILFDMRLRFIGLYISKN